MSNDDQPGRTITDFDPVRWEPPEWRTEPPQFIAEPDIAAGLRRLLAEFGYEAVASAVERLASEEAARG